MGGHLSSSASGSRERLVFLSTWHPEPVDNGQKQRIRAMIDALVERFDIAVISLLPPEEIAGGNLPPIPGVFQQWSLPLPVFEPRSPSAIAAGVRMMPRSFVATWDASSASQIVQITHQIGAAAVVGIDMRTARYLKGLDRGVRTILDSPELSFVLAGEKMTGSPLQLWRMSAMRFKYERFLRSITPQLDLVLLPSEIEAAAYERLSGCDRVVVIENGVNEILAEPWAPPGTNQLLYTGALTYAPNTEAVAYFAREILPRISPAFPDVSLTVTGNVPHVLPSAVVHPSVHLTGRVENLDPIYRQSRLAVVPLLNGTGTRIKILEALAAGMPVVTTSKGAEGLDVVSGEHLVISDSPDGFASAVVRLLRDPDESVRIGQSGRALVSRRYHWDAIAPRLRDVVAGVIHSGAPQEQDAAAISSRS